MMAARRGLLDRLAERARSGIRPRTEPAMPASSSAPTAEALVAGYVAEATAAMRADSFHSWLSRPEPFPRGMESFAEPALQIACLRAALDRLADVCRRMADPAIGVAADASEPSIDVRLPSIVQIASQWVTESSWMHAADVIRVSSARSPDDEREAYLLWLLISRLVARKLPFTPEDVVHLLDRSAAIVTALPSRALEYLPLREILAALVKWAREHEVGSEARAAVERLREAVFDGAGGIKPSKAQREAIALHLLDLLGGGGPEGLLDDRDEWGLLVREALARMEPAQRTAWRPVLEQAATATGPRPTGPWLKRADARIAAPGEEAFRGALVTWLDAFTAPQRGGRGPDGTAQPLLGGTTDHNVTILRGLVWCCSGRDDPQIARAVGAVTEASFKKIPGVGPRFLKLGNAGIYALGEMPGMHGVEQLARLRQRVVYAQARNAIDDALDAAAVRLGIAREDLDDLATPTFDLVDGRRRFDFPPFAAELTAGGAAGAEVRWFGADGVARRTEPAEVQRCYPEERAALKRTVDDLRKAMVAQRDRLERLLLSERSWPLTLWRERYLDHPLLADLTRRLIWAFEGDGWEALGAWRDGAIVDAADRPLALRSEETRVRLWHPVRADRETTAAWQTWLERHGVRQPFKQAHREIYVLTDAERATATYSNRFASHILRQHQFRALAQGRGWTYRLQGRFDGWNAPTLELPGWRLAVEFLVEGIETEEAMTNAGIYPYVATDQVRFRRREYPCGDAVPLAEIPPLVFTEVMRDVDLFVGVASVGTDPTWRDRGPQRIRDYWEGYAFGELTASAQTRRLVLERLVPRLAIAPRCALEDRFLVVRGDLRTYRIHLGSGNILMEPNNQYLCIVPKGSGKDAGSDLFLPFAGDALLTTILSKAILLADDRAITDPTITRQIGGRKG